jgi:hypothetical protein
MAEDKPKDGFLIGSVAVPTAKAGQMLGTALNLLGALDQGARTLVSTTEDLLAEANTTWPLVDALHETANALVEFIEAFYTTLEKESVGFEKLGEDEVMRRVSEFLTDQVTKYMRNVVEGEEQKDETEKQEKPKRTRTNYKVN